MRQFRTRSLAVFEVRMGAAVVAGFRAWADGQAAAAGIETQKHISSVARQLAGLAGRSP